MADEEKKFFIPADDNGKGDAAPHLKGSGTRVSFSGHSPRPRDSHLLTDTDHIVSEGYDGAPMFAGFDPEKMKEGVRQALMRPAYNVHDFYHKQGLWQYIARNPIFENLTLVVITINAVWMMIDTDNNDAATLLEAEPIFQIAEHAFCLYFSFEWFVRFMAFKRKRDGLQDGWFVFDSLLVFMMVAETWVMTAIMSATGGGGSGGGPNTGILRLFRLLRLSRMARMLRSMPELMILIKGMVAATRSVFFTLVLLLAILYIFAIAFTQLCDDTEVGETYFDSILSSMYTLLIVGTFYDNLGDVLSDLGRASLGGHLVYAALFTLFIALAALMVMNMLIGILCEVVSAVAATEKEEMLVAFVKGKMEEVVATLDSSGDGKISKAEFIEIMQNPEAVRALEEVEVDAVGLVDMVDFIFDDETQNADDDDEEDAEKALSLPQLLEVVLQLRGNNTATVKDVVDLRKFIGIGMRRLEERLRKRSSSVYSRITESSIQSTATGTKGSISSIPSAQSIRPPSRMTSTSSPFQSEHQTSPPASPMLEKGLLGRAPSSGEFNKTELHKQLGHVDGFLKAGMFELSKLRHVIQNPANIGAEEGKDGEQQASNSRSAVSAQMAAVEEFLSFALAEMQKAREHVPQMSATLVSSDSEQGVDLTEVRLWMTRLESFIISTGLGELHSLKDKVWKTSTMEETDQFQEQSAWLSKVDSYLTTSVAGLRRIRQDLICELT